MAIDSNVQFPSGTAADKNKGISGYTGSDNKALKNVNGWDSELKGIGGTVNIRLGHAQGVRSYDDNTIINEEPLRLGRFIGVWLRTPAFFEPIIREYFGYFFQDRILEVSGLSDNNITTMERKTGSVGRTDTFAGYYVENNNKFTLKIPEVSGIPAKKTLSWWIHGMSDNSTGMAHMHGKSSTLAFRRTNYTGDFMYILVGPTGQPKDVEFACIWLHAFPNLDPLGFLNSGAIGDTGDAGLTHDVEFAGNYIANSKVSRFAKLMVAAVGLFKDTNEDIVFPSYLEALFAGTTDDLTKEYAADISSGVTNAQTNYGTIIAADAGSASNEDPNPVTA